MHRMCTLTVMAPYTIIALMVSISREMANPTQAFSVGGKTWRSREEQAKNIIGQLHCQTPSLRSNKALRCLLLLKYSELIKSPVCHIPFPLHRSHSRCP